MELIFKWLKSPKILVILAFFTLAAIVMLDKNEFILKFKDQYINNIDRDASEEYADGGLDSQDNKTQTQAPEISIEWWQKELCKPEVLQLQPSTTYLRLPMLGRDITPSPNDYNIFLGETACNHQPLYRAYCSVESYAHENPTAKVWFHTTSPLIDNGDGLITKLEEAYDNLKVVGSDLTKIFSGTPCEKVFMAGEWAHNTPWPANNVSNLLRNVVLWLWGGLNSDTDCICVRNLTHVRNMASYDEQDKVVNNAIMHFDAGHPFTYELMEYLKKNFKVATWVVNGPGAATAIAKKMCGTEDLNEVYLNHCSNVTLRPLREMQLFRWPYWNNYFKDNQGEHFAEEHQDAYIVHLYNKLSKKTAVPIGNKGIYDEIARAHCPVTYEAAKRRTNFF
ncbi:lactosylceramide 4-alpha-galactosyltransferase-like isoform X1 [Penaeus chinensis]|uniref:lactosylceramide 4-alpha-galactosyltransferase-like isoform X1 n=2 Tax=Penaeus chinensis TaxID=139456 RepID=UPI001FB69419|nr:lactosylceramide 4-alpha-galactosyltransferase-like isoform X1 [Penaeus chinensis]